MKFQNGEPFNAQTVKYAFTRAGAEKSTNKDKRLFQAMEFIGTPDPYTVVIGMKTIEPDLLFLLGQATAIIVEPKSSDTNATQPVGTGPFKLENWAKGSSVTLVRWPGYRNAAAVKLAKVTFRFISDPAAQVAALLSGDVDAFQRVGAARSLAQIKADGRFQVITAGSRAKTILAINNKKKPLDDVRVRRAISAAIDRKAVIEGAADGLGAPIGSHYVPGALGYVDTTGINPFNIEKAKALLKEAGVTTPLELTMKLPPPPYARQGGEVIAAQLAKIGIVAKIENVEWAQWLDAVYGKKNYDLTIISHVEPFDLGNWAKPDYYWGYSNPAFNKLFDQINNAPTTAERAKLLGEAQKMIANDAGAALPVPADLADRGQQEGQGSVEGHADLRQRPVRRCPGSDAAGEPLNMAALHDLSRHRTGGCLPQPHAVAGRGDARGSGPHRALGAAPAWRPTRSTPRARWRWPARPSSAGLPAGRSARSTACRR